MYISFLVITISIMVGSSCHIKPPCVFISTGAVPVDVVGEVSHVVPLGGAIAGRASVPLDPPHSRVCRPVYPASHNVDFVGQAGHSEAVVAIPSKAGCAHPAWTGSLV